MSTPPIGRSRTALTAFRGSAFIFAIGALSLGVSLGALYSHRLGWFEKSLTVAVITSSSQGLVPGTPVRMSGLRVGALRSIDLLPDGRVKISLRIRQKYRPWITPESRAVLSPAGLLGSGSIDLTPAPMSRKNIPTSFVVKAEAAPTVESFLEGAEATRSDLQELLQSTNKIANQQLPPALVQLAKSLEAAEQTAGIVNGELPKMSSALTATLNVYAKTGNSADQASREVVETLSSIRPDLLQSLREFSLLMRRSNALLEQFSFLLSPPPSQPSAENNSYVAPAGKD